MAETRRNLSTPGGPKKEKAVSCLTKGALSLYPCSG